MVLFVPVPWSIRPWALPFFTVQAPSQTDLPETGRWHKSVIDCVCLALRLIRRWHLKRTLILVGDGAYAAVELIQFYCRSLSNPLTLVARFPMLCRNVLHILASLHALLQGTNCPIRHISKNI